MVSASPSLKSVLGYKIRPPLFSNPRNTTRSLQKSRVCHDSGAKWKLSSRHPREGMSRTRSPQVAQRYSYSRVFIHRHLVCLLNARLISRADYLKAQWSAIHVQERLCPRTKRHSVDACKPCHGKGHPPWDGVSGTAGRVSVGRTRVCRFSAQPATRVVGSRVQAVKKTSSNRHSLCNATPIIV